ncbi:MAG: carbohydrate-binding domain-containing protein [Oligoflexus sp.]
MKKLHALIPMVTSLLLTSLACAPDSDTTEVSDLSQFYIENSIRNFEIKRKGNVIVFIGDGKELAWNSQQNIMLAGNELKYGNTTVGILSAQAPSNVYLCDGPYNSVCDIYATSNYAQITMLRQGGPISQPGVAQDISFDPQNQGVQVVLRDAQTLGFRTRTGQNLQGTARIAANDEILVPLSDQAGLMAASGARVQRNANGQITSIQGALCQGLPQAAKNPRSQLVGQASNGAVTFRTRTGSVNNGGQQGSGTAPAMRTIDGKQVPVCQNANQQFVVDSLGRQWGWENNRSCIK